MFCTNQPGHSTECSEPLCNPAPLKHVLRSLMWNRRSNCGWTYFLPEASVQTSYIRPTILFLPNTSSHVPYLLVWHTHTPRTRRQPPPIWFAGYYEISLWENGFWPLCSPVLCSTLFNWTPTNLLDATAPLNPPPAPSIIVFPVLGCWCSVWLLCCSEPQIWHMLTQTSCRITLKGQFTQITKRNRFWPFFPSGIWSCRSFLVFRF